MNAKLRDVWDSVSQGAPTARDFEPVESVSPRNHEIPKFRIAPAEGPDSRISTDWNRGVSVIFVQHVRSMYKVKTRRRDQVRSMAAPSIQCTTLLNGPAFHYCLTVGSGEKGEVQIKKPGKMKWVYNSPDPQVLISNHKNLWLYLPEDQQVTRMPIESVYSSNTPALFLAGEGTLTDTFNITKVLTEKNKITVIFTPKEEDSSLSRLVLRTNKKNYQITGASVYDELGNKTDINFHDIRINEEIAESVFEFQVPAGVEVQDFTPNP